MRFVLNSPEIFIGNAKSKVDEQKRELTDETTRDFIRKQLADFAKFHRAGSPEGLTAL